MIVVSGYHGYGNLGDEAILKVLCEGLTDLGVSRQDIVVLTGNKDYTRTVHGVQTVDRYNASQIWQILGQATLLISGGGSLFQDVTSKRSIPYYLGIIEMGLRRNVPLVLYGHGIGPIGAGLYKKLVARVFRRSVGFTVRDSYSAQFLEKHKVPVPADARTVDPVFQWAATNVSRQSRGKPIVGLNLRPYPKWRQQFRNWVQVLNLVFGQGCVLRFIPIGPGDAELGRMLKRHLPQLQLGEPLGLNNFREELGQLELFISMRLHGVILGALSGAVPIAVNYDPKIHSACEQLGSRWVELVELDLVPRLTQEVLQNIDLNRKQQTHQLEQLRQYAARNQDLLRQVLEG